MDKEDTVNIMEEIMACDILDSSPHCKTDMRLPQYEAPDADDDRQNIKVDMSGLLSAIENCGILDDPVSEPGDDRCNTDTDISGLLLAIDNCGILDNAAPDLGDDGYYTDIDMSSLLSAIENCRTMYTQNNMSKESKHQWGRPKKKVTALKSRDLQKLMLYFHPLPNNTNLTKLLSV
ncbi:hypothetical protein BDR04DRAFT_1164607 [Suillus decipiens]|nr:hypothetical protein BDR04DRAFT_1164607 [Suillus decipiens]